MLQVRREPLRILFIDLHNKVFIQEFPNNEITGLQWKDQNI